MYAQQESDDEYNDDEVELNDSMVIDSADFEDIQLDNFLEDFLHDIGYYFDTTNVPAMDSYTGWDMKKIHPYEQKLDYR